MRQRARRQRAGRQRQRRRLARIGGPGLGMGDLARRNAAPGVRLSARLGARLTGPGIRDAAWLSLPEIAAFQRNHARYPLGWDCFFICGDTRAPADAVGLTDRGRLAPGARADVIRVGRIGEAAVLRGVWVAGAEVG